jgi:MATE family multidrug resistance protein
LRYEKKLQKVTIDQMSHLVLNNIQMFKKIRKLLQTEARPTLMLAVPVIISQLGQMIMGVVDTLMVGKLGAESLGGVGIGSAIYSAISVFGLGLILGLDFLVSTAYGRKDIKKCGHWLIQSIYLTVLVSLPLTLFGYYLSYHLDLLGINNQVVFAAHQFLKIFIWSLPTFLFFFCLRTYLQSMNLVGFITITMILGNLVNAFLNWVFIYGHLGVHSYLTAGCGIATFITRLFILLAVAGYTLYKNNREKWGLLKQSWRPSFEALRRLLSLGVPASMQLLFEVAVFSLATLLAGKLEPASLAAHSIVLNIASMTFMVPLGLAMVTSVRVGQYLGGGRRDLARNVGWASIIMGIIFMTASGFILFSFSHGIITLFTQDEKIFELAKKIILIAALFQIADGIQTIGTGALRGLGNTRSAMIANLIGHWGLGLPVGYYLCFNSSLKISGLWVGLTVGLISVATFVLRSWISETTEFQTKVL